MKSFTYKRADTLKNAYRYFEDDKVESVYHAGGTDQLSLIKHEIIAPDQLIDIKSIPGMDTVEIRKDNSLMIGAGVTIADLAKNDTIKKQFKVLQQAAGHIASPQLRNMATVAGNLCQRPRCWYYRGDFDCLRKGGEICYAVGGENKYHAIIGGDPCFIVHPSDLAVALMALNAKLHIFSEDGKRELPLEEFFVLPAEDPTKEHRLEKGEIITAIEVPALQKESVSAYEKVKERGSWDFAIVSVGMVLKAENGTIKSGRFAFGGVAPVPWLEKQFNNALNSGINNQDRLEKAIKSLFTGAFAMEQNEYKTRMARQIVERMLSEAIA